MLSPVSPGGTATPQLAREPAGLVSIETFCLARNGRLCYLSSRLTVLTARRHYQGASESSYLPPQPRGKQPPEMCGRGSVGVCWSRGGRAGLSLLPRTGGRSTGRWGRWARSSLCRAADGTGVPGSDGVTQGRRRDNDSYERNHHRGKAGTGHAGWVQGRDPRDRKATIAFRAFVNSCCRPASTLMNVSILPLKSL